MSAEPVSWVELDVDGCSRTFDIGLCGASLEPSQLRTNYAIRSQDLGNAAWSTLNTTVVSNDPATPAPDGTLTASKHTENGATAEHRVQLATSVVIPGLPTASVFLRAGARTQAVLTITRDNITALASPSIVVNLLTGAIVSGTGGTVEDAGDGWWRVSVTATSAGANYSMRIGGALAGSVTYTGDGTSSFFIWGAQLEFGAPVSAYIKTEATAVSANWGGAIRKCYNTFATCRSVPTFKRTATFRTLRFAEPRSNMPKGSTYFPALTSVSEQSSTVNIAGSDDDMAALGRRATVRVGLVDFPYHDRLTDPYQRERVSGAAQIDEPGYDPGQRGTFFAKLKRRWPYYAGRPLRVINAQIVNGALTGLVTRHYVITDMNGPDDDGRVTFEASDVLDLAKNEKAVAPEASNGALATDITTGLVAFSLQPAGIGASEYPAFGRALIGSEIVSYTRAGDVVTLTARGVAKSIAATHNAGDTFQQVLHVNLSRIDTLIQTLLIDYAGINPAFIPMVKWTAEIDRWLPDLLLEAHIVKPTGVATLIGELAILGVSVWWDSALQEIGLKANRPPADDPVYDLTDDANIKGISVEDRDDKRLTQIHFSSVMADPTKSTTAKENYDRLFVTPDLTSERPEAFGGARIREVLCRWLNQGNNDLIRTLSGRLLARFKTAPQHFTILLDAKDTIIGLTDVLRVNSRSAQDETGKPETRLLQVIERSEPRPGHEIRIVAQAYQFDLRFALIGPDTLPVYGSATADQKRVYGFIGADTEPAFADGSDYYRIV